MKKVFDVRCGDMSKPDEKKMLEAQSPLNSATNIRSPLLVVQGANDPGSGKRSRTGSVIALRDRGMRSSILVAPDEGHRLCRPRQQDGAVCGDGKIPGALTSAGAARIPVPPGVKKRLDVLTVDVKVREGSGRRPAESAWRRRRHRSTVQALQNIRRQGEGHNQNSDDGREWS